MAFREYIFSGKAAWITDKAQEFDGKQKWSLAFYPKTAADRKEVQGTGIKNKPQVDDGKGIEEGLLYFRLRNDKEAYKIMDQKGQPITVPISNGADVLVKLVVETFNSPKYGASARSWLTEVVVTAFTPYEKPAVEPVKAETELPA